MRKMYLFIVGIATVFVACDKGGGIDPQIPDPPVTISVETDTTLYDGQATVSWSASALQVKVNGETVPLAGTITLYNLKNDSILTFVAMRNDKTVTKSVKVVVRSQKYSWVAGSLQYPFGAKWKNVKMLRRPAGWNTWTTEYPPYCSYLSFRADGNWFGWRGTCGNDAEYEDSTHGADGWDIIENDTGTVFRWGTDYWKLVEITSALMIWEQTSQDIAVPPSYSDWQLTWERVF